jgi:hypothetical protein
VPPLSRRLRALGDGEVSLPRADPDRRG